MKIAVITNLNANLIRAKLIPLSKVEFVDEIYFITDSLGPKINKVRYLIPSKLSYRIFLHKFFAKHFLLKKTVREYSPDLIMAYNILPHGYSAGLIARKYNKKFALHLIGGYSDIEVETDTTDNSLAKKFPVIHNKLSRLNKKAASKCDFLFVPGCNTQKMLIEKLTIDREKIFKLHSTVDTERFKPQNIKKEFDLIMVSALTERKNIKLFLEAISIVKNKIPGIKAAILGKGNLENSLKQRAKELGIEANVSFPGFHGDIENFYNRSKVFILTSNFEGLSCSAMEAMACGLPVIVPDISDMSELFIEQPTGVLIKDLTSPDAYASAIIKLISDENLRSSLSKNARDLILKNHSYDVAIQKWRNFLTNFNGFRCAE